MPFSKAKTTIELFPETRDKLKDLGKMGDKYDDVIKDLLKLAEKHSPELKRIQEEQRKV